MEDFGLQDPIDFINSRLDELEKRLKRYVGHYAT